jgi:hypothetical protein
MSLIFSKMWLCAALKYCECGFLTHNRKPLRLEATFSPTNAYPNLAELDP